MSIQLIIAISTFLIALGIIFDSEQHARLTFWLMFLAAAGYGFVLGWLAYDRYHGVL